MEACRQIAQWLKQCQRAVAFTGAGISTESGIPDFRSPGGIWAVQQPIYYQEYLDSGSARYEYWLQKTRQFADFAAAEPNLGHRKLAEWEQRGLLLGVITQNIDGLHQIAGSRRVLELHGTARQVSCLDCSTRFDTPLMHELFQAADAVPPCPACGGLLKHAVVSFGQSLPADVLQESIQLAKQADLLIVLGSSLVVEPAASLPRYARQYGARVVIINRDPTPQDDAADCVVHDSIGTTLVAIDACLSAA
jgi:NAD-dependent deacetylase